MNDESLRRANAILAAVAARIAVGDAFREPPSVIGRGVGIDDPLASARAVRALLRRGRLVARDDGGYELRDATPIRADEKGSAPAGGGARRRPRDAAPRAIEPPAGATFSDVGREAIQRLLALQQEVAGLRDEAREARDEARESRSARIDAESRATAMAERVRELESRAQMAENNLRTLLATARTSGRDAAAQSGEMEAILGVLRGDRGEP